MNQVPDSKKETLVESAYQWIREAILDGNIQPGAKLIERELTQATGVSRSALREALASLDEKGLVHREPYRGYRVTNLTKKQVQDLYELREVVRFVRRDCVPEYMEAVILKQRTFTGILLCGHFHFRIQWQWE